jgi:hypothetical protein
MYAIVFASGRFHCCTIHCGIPVARFPPNGLSAAYQIAVSTSTLPTDAKSIFPIFRKALQHESDESYKNILGVPNRLVWRVSEVEDPPLHEARVLPNTAPGVTSAQHAIESARDAKLGCRVCIGETSHMEARLQGYRVHSYSRYTCPSVAVFTLLPMHPYILLPTERFFWRPPVPSAR